MKVQELFEEAGLAIAQRTVDGDMSGFKKLGLGPLPKLVDRVLLAIPKGSFIVRTDDAGETVDFFYNRDGNWFDNSGKRVRVIQTLVNTLKNSPEIKTFAMVPA